MIGPVSKLIQYIQSNDGSCIKVTTIHPIHLQALYQS